MDRAEGVRVLRAVGTRFRACDFAFFEDRLTRGPLSERVRGRSGAWYTVELHVARDEGGVRVRVTAVLDADDTLGERPLSLSFAIAPDGAVSDERGPSPVEGV